MNLSLAYNMMSAKFTILRACKKTDCYVCPLFDRDTSACSVGVKEWTKLPSDEDLDKNRYLEHIDWETRWDMRKDYLRRSGFSYERRGRRHVWARGDEDYDVQHLKDMSDTAFANLIGENEAEIVNADILPRAPHTPLIFRPSGGISPIEVNLDRANHFRGISTIME